MASKTLMVSPSFIKKTSFVEDNVDVDIIRDAIDTIQDLYILPLLGTALFDRVKDEVESTVSANIATLLNDHIQKVIKWYVIHEIADTLTFRFVNKAVMKKSSDNSSPVDTVDLERLRGGFKDKAEVYADRMVNFLCEEATAKYTEYQNPGSRVDTIHPKRFVYETGIFLGATGVGDPVTDLINRLENDFIE